MRTNTNKQTNQIKPMKKKHTRQTRDRKSERKKKKKKKKTSRIGQNEKTTLCPIGTRGEPQCCCTSVSLHTAVSLPVTLDKMSPDPEPRA